MTGLNCIGIVRRQRFLLFVLHISSQFQNKITLADYCIRCQPGENLSLKTIEIM